MWGVGSLGFIWRKQGRHEWGKVSGPEKTHWGHQAPPTTVLPVKTRLTPVTCWLGWAFPRPRPGITGLKLLGFRQENA